VKVRIVLAGDPLGSPIIWQVIWQVSKWEVKDGTLLLYRDYENALGVLVAAYGPGQWVSAFLLTEVGK
jgi:hypothetical protein